MTTYEKPLPVLTKLNRPYFEGARLGELRLQKCNACGRVWFPASSHCPRCLSDDAGWIAASGRGKVWSWVVFHQRYFEAFADDLPYNVALIELEEGPMMMSTIVGATKEEIHCEMPVEVVFDEATEEVSVPKFRPSER